VEDRIDAVVCAYVVLLAYHRPERVMLLGTVQEGCILTPVIPTPAR
jgi:predicted RNase H-like nuclease